MTPSMETALNRYVESQRHSNWEWRYKNLLTLYSEKYAQSLWWDALEKEYGPLLD